MAHVVQTEQLVSEGILNRLQADEIIRRSRDTMLALIVNVLLTGGIIAAALGFVFWIADPLGVAVLGLVFLMGGGAVLMKRSRLYGMLGNAAALIGAGMLFSGAGFELLQNFPDYADYVMLPVGAVAAAVAAWIFRSAEPEFRFSIGSIGLMGLAMHLAGGLHYLDVENVSGLWSSLFSLYAAAAIAAAGVFVNVRFVTALAIVPFAQALNTSTEYFHAAYVFYSPESTLTILQMSALIGACLYVCRHHAERIARHAGITAIMAAVVGALAFLVGTLWGDYVGLSLFRDQRPLYGDFGNWQDYRAAYDAWKAQFFHISEEVYSVAFAAVLIAGAWIAAVRHKRGLFNTAITFLGIHAYTQMFESFADEPAAWALGGLALVPIAWGMWRLNARMFRSA